MKTSLKISLIVLAVLSAVLLSLVVVWFALTADARLQPEKLALAERTLLLFDANGEPIEAQSDERVPFAELPAHLPDAFVAVEDKRFYRHGGVDPRRMLKAAAKNVFSFSFREGASTISQQLIKNTHLSGEKTLKRKLREIKLARELEKNYTKEEILELYLNSIYFGHSAFGVGSAARFYFGKSPAELNAAESAMLAALVKSPNRYSPFRDPEACKKRRDFVLSLMAEQGFLEKTEAERAKAEPLPAQPFEEKTGNETYLGLVFEELAALFPDAGAGERLSVYTHLEPDLQEELAATEAESDCAIVVRSVKEDAVRAAYSTCGLVKRLPASTVKPLAVYGPALEENLASPATPILDEKTNFGGYSPSDYGGSTDEYMSVRYALAHSVNVPAVKLMSALGPDRAAEYLEKLGLPVAEEDRTLALALGGMKEGYTLASLADGYAVFARGGTYAPARTIAKIETASGRILFDGEKKSAGTPVFSEDVCALMNDMLKTAATEGTAKKLKTLPFEVCAKTGTGGTEAGNTDAYTLAYTSEDVVGVWMGNRDNSPVSAMGGGAPANAAKRVLSFLYAQRKPAPFAQSENVVTARFDREEYEKNHRLLLSDPVAPDCLSMSELFRKCALPAGTCDKFSRPKIQNPQISVQNGSVRIILCQTEYYDYVVKRECEGQISVIYRGKYRKELFDNAVLDGKSYVYTVVPYYRGIEGEAVTLPPVCIKKSSGLPDDWWE